MLFSSIPFLFYFLPPVLLLYFLTPDRWKNLTLLLSSLVFYGWGEPRFLLFMLAAIAQGYAFGRLMERYPRHKRLFLILSAVLSLSLLGYCKYAGFFLRTLGALTGLSLPALQIALPIGITLELLWQDVIAMGTVIHPFGGMAFLLLFPFARTAHFVDAGSMLLPLILAMLCAQAGSWLEQRYRIYEDRFLPDMEAADPHPEKVVYQSILRRAGMHAILYAVSYALLCGVVCTLLALGVYPIIPDLSWTFVYAAALSGALLAIRSRTAYIAFLMGLCVISALIVFRSNSFFSV